MKLEIDLQDLHRLMCEWDRDKELLIVSRNTATIATGLADRYKADVISLQKELAVANRNLAQITAAIQIDYIVSVEDGNVKAMHRPPVVHPMWTEKPEHASSHAHVKAASAASFKRRMRKGK